MVPEVCSRNSPPPCSKLIAVASCLKNTSLRGLVREPTTKIRSLFWGIPKSFALRTCHQRAYPSSENAVRMLAKSHPFLLDNNPLTFSKIKYSGFFSWRQRINSQTSRDLPPTIPERLPAMLKSWQGLPPVSRL